MKRIKYISRFSKLMSSGEIHALVKQAMISNKENKITGILMASGGLFFQVIEGPKENIDLLYSAILEDKRHKDVLVLSIEENLKSRLFPDWSMKKIDLDKAADVRTEPLKVILETIFQQRKILDDLTNALERTSWHEMVDEGCAE
ncbi:BLUF domain-containing protein [candidate division CSSED10-310 bacterium]|uniref:BLUF domain-containing protein n=1 Tax=candidate division CSSED10-310 bacterium TaxID=2855610 RepID=A0ABV6Z2Y3_UNCC1